MALDLMTSSDDNKSRTLALSGLLIVDNSTKNTADADVSPSCMAPSGTEPTAEEIWAWMHDDVPDKRATEIRSYLAFNSSVYDTWRQLRIAQNEITISKSESSQIAESGNEPNAEMEYSSSSALASDSSTSNDKVITSINQESKSRTGSKRTMLGIGLGVAACFLTVLLVRSLTPTSPPPNFWQNWQVAKSSSQRPLSEDENNSLQRVLGGLASQMAEEGLPASGPQGQELQITDCDSNQNCTEQENALEKLGRNLVFVRLECLNPSDSIYQKADILSLATDIVASTPSLALVSQPLQEIKQIVTNSEPMPLSSSEGQIFIKTLCGATSATIERLLISK